MKSIRERIVFAKQDIINDPPFSRLDLVACRNLLMYFRSNLQARLIAMFHYALNPDGILFLGKSESVGQQADLFTPISKKMMRRANVPVFIPLYDADVNVQFVNKAFEKTFGWTRDEDE